MSVIALTGVMLGGCFGVALASNVDDPNQATTTGPEGVYETAIIESITTEGETSAVSGKQVDVYHVRFTSGAEEGMLRDVQSDVSSNPYGLKPSVGNSVVVFVQQDADGNEIYFIEGFDRRGAILGLVGLFIAVIVLLAGWQGVKVAFSILLSLAMIGYILIPLFLRGVHPVPVAILLSGVFTLISTGLSTGWNKKSLMTAIGTMGGAMIAFLVSWIFADMMHLGGLSTEEDRLFFDKNPLLNPQGLLFAGIIIASAGVVEDVAVSIMSGVEQVKRVNARLSMRELFRAGMVIGNDHMAALANTLVYAYVGGSLSTLLLYEQFGESWLKFVNFDVVVDEILRSLSGTIGLLFTVPITALLAAWVLHKARVDEDAPVDHAGHGHHH